MLLPIVLILASAAATANPAAVNPEPSSTSKKIILSNPGPSTFAHHLNPQSGNMPDPGIMLPRNPCIAERECQVGCLSITAYVFSDGENPELKYVTHCPNLELPYQNERARRNSPGPDHQPTLRRTN
jgi:hypothetical protein